MCTEKAFLGQKTFDFVWCVNRNPYLTLYILLPRLQKKPVDFDDELKIGDVRYDNLTKITIKVQLF